MTGWAVALMVLAALAPAAAQEPATIQASGMTFVRIPAGIFTMGSPVEERYRDAGELQHQVSISRPFYLQTTEVTVSQWQAVMGRPLLARKKGIPEMPVVRVSWFDCQKFIQRLKRQTGHTFRLPTEAEWEYACRAGSTAAYAWAETLACSQAMFANNPQKHNDCVDAHRRAGRDPGMAAPVQAFAPNAWGLYDMHGNVWEWCEDLYHPYEGLAVVDPCRTEKGRNRIRRGGSWFGPAHACRSANRAYGHPMSRLQNTGFRLVMELPTVAGALPAPP